MEAVFPYEIRIIGYNFDIVPQNLWLLITCWVDVHIVCNSAIWRISVDWSERYSMALCWNSKKIVGIDKVCLFSWPKLVSL